MKRGLMVVLSFSFVLLTSCVTVPKPESFDKQQQFGAPSNKTWASIVEILSDSKWPIESIEKDSGLLTTAFVNMGHDADKYTDCPTLLSIISQRRGKLSIFVKSASENETSVKINTHFEGFNEEILSKQSRWVICNSTGKLEREIFTKIKESPGN